LSPAPHRRAAQLLASQLRRGLTPHELALTLAVGLCLSVPPVLGTTTILCAIAAFRLRLNQPLIQAVNFFAYPLQLALMIPFFRAGEWLFREPRATLSPGRIVSMARLDLTGTIDSLWTVIWHGAVVWAIVSIPAGFLLYAIFRPIIERVANRLRREEAPAAL